MCVYIYKYNCATGIIYIYKYIHTHRLVIISLLYYKLNHYFIVHIVMHLRSLKNYYDEFII